VAADGNKETFVDEVAFNLDHGAGHLSGLQHAGQVNGYDNYGNSDIEVTHYVPDGPNVMSDGLWIQRNHNKYKLKDYINSPSNQQQPGNNGVNPTVSIKLAYLHRFSAPTPIATLPTQPTQ
jgi:hypothetical protein